MLVGTMLPRCLRVFLLASPLCAIAQVPAATEPALPPADAANIRGIVDKDIAAALDSGDLGPGSHGGVTIGVLSHGKRVVWSYGIAHDDSIYEIGSITKTFTATILAQMVEQKQVALDTPVRELLPPGTVAKPEGRELELIDLSDQHSGLPRMPPLKPAQTIAEFGWPQLLAYLHDRGVAYKPDTPFLYSNLGVGLMGAALAHKAGMSWSELLQHEVTGPLGLKETAVNPTDRGRGIQGYRPNNQPSPAWNRNILVGAGGLRSTAADILTWLDAQLHPDALPGANAGPASTLPAAIKATHVPHADTTAGRKICLNWFWNPATNAFWHNGATDGYTSYAVFNPTYDFGVIVLYNHGTGSDGFADKLGMHIAQRMMGKPALVLAK